jgi:hypothetical protein
MLGDLQAKISNNPKYFTSFQPDQTRSTYEIILQTMESFRKLNKELSGTFTAEEDSELSEDFMWIEGNLMLQTLNAKHNFNSSMFEKAENEKQSVCSRPGCCNTGKLMVRG